MSEKNSYAYKVQGISLPMGLSTPEYIIGHNRAQEKAAEIAMHADGRITDLETQVDRLQSQLAEKDERIKFMSTQIADLVAEGEGV